MIRRSNSLGLKNKPPLVVQVCSQSSSSLGHLAPYEDVNENAGLHHVVMSFPYYIRSYGSILCVWQASQYSHPGIDSIFSFAIAPECRFTVIHDEN